MKDVIITILGCISLQTKIHQIFNDDLKVEERNCVKIRNGIKQQKAGTLREQDCISFSLVPGFELDQFIRALKFT